MPIREPKSRTKTSIVVIGRDAKTKGTIEISSGNLTFYRAGAKNPTEQWTLQQLLELLERDLETRQALKAKTSPISLPDGEDLKMFIYDVDGKVNGESNELIVDDCLSLRKIDRPGKQDHGTFQIDSAPRTGLGYRWSLELGISVAIYIIDLYVKKRLSGKQTSTATNKQRPVSRAQLSVLLRKWLHAIGA